VDKKLILSYLGKKFPAPFKDDQAKLREVCMFISEQIKIFTVQKKEPLVRKYSYLRDYFTRQDYWLT